MIDTLSAAILGVVEGVTEFLPVSSTGHLILVNHWFTFSESFTKLFDIVIQAGAILAVVVLFWKDIVPPRSIFKSGGLKASDPWISIWLTVFVAFVPTAVIGALFGSWAQDNLFTPWIVSAALIFYGIIFLFVESWHARKTQLASSKLPSYRDALIIGLAQALALVPGTSRSGVTIIALLLLGYARPAAARFSFLLALPTILAASAYALLKYHSPIQAGQYSLLAIGFALSFAAAFVVSRWFMNFVKNHTFKTFGWYRIVLGALVVLAMVWHIL